MLYMIHCIDKPDHLQVRLAHREAHLNYVASFADRIFAAGPLMSEDDGMQGSVLIMEFDDLREAETFSANDPYVLGGVFERVHISRWKKTLPAD